MNERDKMISRIETVLRRCDPKANATEAEVEQAMAFAQTMMRKYDVEMAEVMAAKGEDLDMSAIGETIVREHSKTDKHELAILNALCLICGVKAYTTTVYKEGKRKKQMVIYGAKADMAMCHKMFTELIVLVRAMARFKVPGRWTQKHYWYCNGFGNGLYAKAVELQAKQEREDAAPATAPTATTTALIVRKDALIERYATENLGLKPARRSRSSRAAMLSSEYATGNQDGRDYEFHDKLSSGNTNGGSLEDQR